MPAVVVPTARTRILSTRVPGARPTAICTRVPVPSRLVLATLIWPKPTSGTAAYCGWTDMDGLGWLVGEEELVVPPGDERRGIGRIDRRGDGLDRRQRRGRRRRGGLRRGHVGRGQRRHDHAA